MRVLAPVAVALAVVLSSGCGSFTDDGGDAQGASPGFDIEPNDDGYMMRLSREALSQPFLLAPALASGPPLALSVAYPPRIVRFQEKGGRLYLFEDTTKTSLPAHHLLASFEIDAVSADGVLTFDFNKGITSFLVSMINEFGDLGSGGDAPDGVLASVIDKVYVKGNDLFVDQFVEMSQSAGGKPFVAQVKYTLSPYAATPGFAKRTGIEAFAKVGFFENWLPERDAQGHERYWINRWDASKPIVFHVPTTIPEDFKPAVRDGILYWNRAFGREVVQVQDLPAGVLPHEPGYNVVQWIEDETMDFAYADWVSDPMTGETKQAQIFVPTTFVVDSRAAAASFLAAPRARPAVSADGRRARAFDVSKLSNRKDFQLGEAHVPGRRPKACFENRRSAFADTLGQVLALDAASDEAVKRFAQDFVRALVAHEIGHTLGLRHNFHAKNGATLPPTELNFALANYMKTGNPPLNLTITNSVMDYLGFQWSALAGAQIRLGQPAFKYDAAAIAWAYAPAADHRAIDFGGFCSDEAVSTMPDCVTFATPGPPIEATFTDWMTVESRAVAGLAARFIAAKAPLDGGPSVPVQEVRLEPSDAAFDYTDSLFYLSAMLKDFKTSKARFLKIAESFKYTSTLNRDEEDAAILAYQTSAVAAFGGIASLLTSLTPVLQADGTWLPPVSAGAAQRFRELIAAPGFATGAGPHGNAFAFSAEELGYMTEIADGYYEKLGERLLVEAIAILVDEVAGPYAAWDKDGTAASLKAMATAILLADGSESVSGDVGGVVVDAKKPYYEQKFRLAATRLLAPSMVDAFPETFNEGAGAELKTALEAKLKALTRDDVVPVEDLPVELKKLAIELQEVIGSLPNTEPPT